MREEKAFEKFLEVGRRVIVENLSDEKTKHLTGYCTSVYGYHYIVVHSIGVISTIHDIPDTAGIERMKTRHENVEKLIQDAFENAKNPVALKRSELRKKISAACGRKRSVPVLIVLPGCVVNARELLEIMEACCVDEIYMTEVPCGKSIITIPYVRNEYGYQDGTILPVMGQNVENRVPFEVYVPHGVSYCYT